jgi:hypothetical protein
MAALCKHLLRMRYQWANRNCRITYETQGQTGIVEDQRFRFYFERAR